MQNVMFKCSFHVPNNIMYYCPACGTETFDFRYTERLKFQMTVSEILVAERAYYRHIKAF
jgi:hypothetical protein